jgi:HD-GYP domain-containing protein (c-di-GMP phosphodiesterase class II)
MPHGSHENWDGTGYPDGLAGDAIPLTARIVQVADAFDAMTGGRPDGAPLERVAGLAELARCAGTQFDPTLVKEFALVADGAAGEIDLDLVADVVASTHARRM